METRDFICVCLGVCSKKVDDICDDFLLDIDESDVKYLLDSSRCNYKGFGDRLIAYLYMQAKDDAVKDFGLDEDKFDWHINGLDSHLYYDRQEVHKYSDFERIADSIENEDETDDKSNREEA